MSELSADAQQKVLELKQEYIDSFPGKIQHLEMCWQNIQSNQYAHDELEALRGACHKLAGSAGCYEFLQISDAAREVEQLCSTDTLGQGAKAEDPVQVQIRADFEYGYRLLVKLLEQQS